MQVYKYLMTPHTRHGLKTDKSCRQCDTHGLPSEPGSTGKVTKPFPLLSVCLLLCRSLGDNIFICHSELFPCNLKHLVGAIMLT